MAEDNDHNDDINFDDPKHMYNCNKMVSKRELTNMHIAEAGKDFVMDMFKESNVK